MTLDTEIEADILEEAKTMGQHKRQNQHTDFRMARDRKRER